MKPRPMYGSAFVALAALTIISCITVNIYFPAAEVREQAEQIVDEVYGIESPDAPDGKKPGDSAALDFVWNLIAPRSAHAEDATTVSNANIRAIKSQLATNHGQLLPYYDQGRVGIAKDGMLTIRDEQGLNFRDLAALRRLVKADNDLRTKLYQEVGRAMNIDPGQTAKTQGIYADMWRTKAQRGWWVQEDTGAWVKK